MFGGFLFNLEETTKKDSEAAQCLHTERFQSIQHYNSLNSILNTLSQIPPIHVQSVSCDPGV